MHGNYGDLIGESTVHIKVLKRIDRFATSDRIVLISGETGTGKELVAHAWRAESSYAMHPIVVVNTPEENTDTPMSDETEADTIDETELLDRADAFLPEDVVSADAVDPSKMSRFGLGPYPEIPKDGDYPPNYFETASSIEKELLRRIHVKMYNEGILDKYGSVGVNPSTGMIIALERGSVLVEYEIDKNGEKRIWSALAHPDDLSQGMYTRECQIPSDLKIVTAEEIAFDTYEYLGLSK